MSDPKRFCTEQEIIAAIDRARELARIHLRNAESYDMDIKAIQMRADPSEEWMIHEKTRMARRSRKLATSLLDVRCKWLGEKLSEFRTMLLPIIDDQDISIPRRKAPTK